jgi:hypothetical protein
MHTTHRVYIIYFIATSAKVASRKKYLLCAARLMSKQGLEGGVVWRSFSNGSKVLLFIYNSPLFVIHN